MTGKTACAFKSCRRDLPGVPNSHDDPSPELWQETYLSAILRAILYADDPNYSLQGFRRLEPITTPEGELRFLQVAEQLFPKGWQLGSEPEIQVASIVSNHLTSGIMKYFGDSFRFDQAANLFEKLSHREPEVASLLAQSYIGMSTYPCSFSCFSAKQRRRLGLRDD